MPRAHLRLAFALLGFATTGPFSVAASTVATPDATLVLPGGDRPLDLDDMVYFQHLRRVVVPGAQTGNLVFIDPATDAISVVAVVKPNDGDEGGVASAALAGDAVFTADVTNGTIAAVDLRSKMVVARARLAGKADYVRHVEATDEVWVTEPREAGRIEILAVARGQGVHLVLAQTIPIPGGPEALVFDERSGRAFTNTFGDKTMVIDVHSRAVTETWSNGCGDYTPMARGARGLALDAGSNILYVACMQGKVIGLDVAHHGQIVSTTDVGPGVDMIAFSAGTRHLFVPSSKSGILTVFETTARGTLKQVAQYRTAQGSHCVITDDARKVYVCDPGHGRVFAIADPQAQR